MAVPTQAIDEAAELRRLHHMAQRLADEHQEEAYLVLEPETKSEFTPTIPYAVLSSVADKWERQQAQKDSNAGVFRPQAQGNRSEE